MRHQILSRHFVIVPVAKNEFHSTTSFSLPKTVENTLGDDGFVSKLLDRRWALSSPDAKINRITLLDRKEGGLSRGISFQNNTQPCLGEDLVGKSKTFPGFYVVRDDLLHPLVNGNKARKLDALLPLLEDNYITDVVTCGGCQSAHAAAVAVSCAERGLKSHLLLRGEEPETLTGYNLVSKLYGDVVYIPRSLYAKREEMLMRHATSVAGRNGTILWLNDILEASFKYSSEQPVFSREDYVTCDEKSRKVVIINEGAGDAMALLGVMRLIHYLSQDHLFGKKQALKLVVDAGTGTTAIGLSLGVLCLGLPWEVTAVMLADSMDSYRKKGQNLISRFLESSTCCSLSGQALNRVNSGTVHWVERKLPRKFGNILRGEVQECQKVAQQTGILVDPIYTLAAWDIASQLSQNGEEDSKVVMIHTGGTLGMFGLAQRYKAYFQMPKEDVQ